MHHLKRVGSLVAISFPLDGILRCDASLLYIYNKVLIFDKKELNGAHKVYFSCLHLVFKVADSRSK